VGCQSNGLSRKVYDVLTLLTSEQHASEYMHHYEKHYMLALDLSNRTQKGHDFTGIEKRAPGQSSTLRNVQMLRRGYTLCNWLNV
jgi:hypothetical protein